MSVLNPENLFVYGTLRTGKENVWFVRGKLYRLGWYPGAKFSQSKPLGRDGSDPNSPPIIGNIIEVTNRRLETELDRYEGFCIKDDPRNSRNLYFRRIIVAYNELGEKKTCWVYEFNREPSEDKLIKSGDWFDAETTIKRNS